jgi:hypothetical protein
MTILRRFKKLNIRIQTMPKISHPHITGKPVIAEGNALSVEHVSLYDRLLCISYDMALLQRSLSVFSCYSRHSSNDLTDTLLWLQDYKETNIT